MFSGSGFNQDISRWVITTECTSVFRMFAFCEFNFGQPSGNGAYNTVYDNGTSDPFASWDASNIADFGEFVRGNGSFNANVDTLLANNSAVTSMTRTFEGSRAFNNGGAPNDENAYPLAWSLPRLSSLAYAFQRATGLRQSIAALYAPMLTNLEYAFYNNKQYEDRMVGLASWPISRVARMLQMCNGDNTSEQMRIPSADLDAIYTAWGAGPTQLDVSVHWGNSQYSAFGEAFRQVLLDRGWEILGDSCSNCG
jgi:hypothetical protein